MRKVHVALDAHPYDIHIGSHLLEQAGEQIEPLLSGKKILVITDEYVAATALTRLEQGLARAGLSCASIILPAGEKTKSFGYLEELVQRIFAHNPDRSTMLIALGGGVVGDLVGFAASIVLRGVDFIQIPTTLLAQVDSSVGGKTAINLPQGKNLVGAFYQPRLVLADITTLQSLPRRQWLAGYAEVVKYGVIADADFFTWLEAHGERGLAGDEAALIHLIETSCSWKARIVAQDEREAGQRALLNFGHTLGHALEAEAGYSDALLHGEAVAIGMVFAAELAVRLGLCPKADAERLAAHLERAGLPHLHQAPALPDAQALITHMRRDKKSRHGKVTFVLPRTIGNAAIFHDVPEDAITSLWHEVC